MKSRRQNCTSQYRCNKCNNHHHISLSEEETKGENPDNTNVHFNENWNNILLQTAIGHVSCVGRNDYRNDFRLRRFTYVCITSELRNSLNLWKICTKNLMIPTFGNTKGDVKHVDVVQLKVKGQCSNTDVYVEAICIPTICTPRGNQKLDISAIK